MWKNYLKLIIFAILRHVPGKLGTSSETRYYWALRKIRIARGKGVIEHYLGQLGEGAICLDLGANIGDVTALLLEHATTVYAFEPEPWAFSQLEARFADNKNVLLMNKAVGNANGEITFYRHPEFHDNKVGRSQATTMFRNPAWGDAEVESFVVKQVDICDVIAGIGKPIDIIKMDIEGAEVDVLERLFDAPELSSVKTILVETHEVQMPQLRARTEAIRKHAKTLSGVRVFMDWH